MTEKIYEYKDDKNWFIGKWEGFNNISHLGEVHHLDDEVDRLRQTLRSLMPEEDQWSPEHELKGYDVTVVRFSSAYRLIAFVIDIIKAETGRQLAVKQHNGAILVTEGEQLLLAHLPEGGVKTADFFAGAGQLGDSILIATKNEGKTKEFRRIFGQMGIAVENLNDYPDLPEVEETGTTFEENARLKAETIAQLTGKMVLADDSGLKVDVLGGLPGIWSARFSGPDATDASNRAKLLHELATVFEKKDRSAQFHCTLVVAAPGKESLVVEADWPGYIAFEEKGDQGFGYDKIFYVEDMGKTSAELGTDYKNEHGHRGLAVKKLLEVFPEWQASN